MQAIKFSIDVCMMLRNWFVILVVLFPVLGFASSAKEDSILALLPRMPNDTDKVNTYNQLFKVNFSVDSEKAEKWGVEGLNLAHKLNYKRGIAKMSNNLGVLQSKMGNYERALQYYEGALEIRALEGDSTGMAICRSNIGSAYYKRGFYELALDNYGWALRIFLEDQDTVGILGALNNIGSIYNEQGQYEAALRTYFFVLQLRETRDDRNGLALSRYNVGTIYHQMGMLDESIRFLEEARATYIEDNDLFGLNPVLIDLANIRKEQNQLEKARDLYTEALANAKALNDRFTIANSLQGMAMLDAKMGNYAAAEQGLDQAYGIYEQIDRRKGKAETLNHLGKILMDQQRFRAAVPKLQASLEIAQRLEARELIRDDYRMLAQALAGTGNYQPAYESFAAFFALHDSIYTKEKAAQFAELNARYRAREQQVEIDRLNLKQAESDLRIERSRQRNYLLFGGFIVVGLVAMIFYVRYRQKQRTNRKIERMNAEVQAQRDRVEEQNRQIREINANLERIIEARTAAVVSAKNELDTFLYESAHALRRPLTRIEGLTQLLRIEPDPAAQSDLRHKMAFTIRGMDRLLHKLIVVNENEKRDVRFEAIDVAALVREISHELQAGPIDLQMEPPQGFVLYSDRYLISALLLNLLENCVHYCSDPRVRNPEIRVRLRKEETTVCLEVEDNGQGIPADRIPQLFDMFYRVHNRSGSNGLGLYVVRKVVDRLHGKVALESTVGVGTKVVVELPRQFV
ncbi:MAG: tetratricopeptide repeat-containing sensor histidine kinase [Bacteroidota bacterium]